FGLFARSSASAARCRPRLLQLQQQSKPLSYNSWFFGVMRSRHRIILKTPSAGAEVLKEPFMRKFAAIPICVVLLTLSMWSQAAKSDQPTAVIDTTAGKLTCKLFPDKAPIGVANFIGLSEGTKDWTSPVTHAKKHGVPLYDGTICHRVIPNFMIQCGDPAGTGAGDPGFQFKNETSPDLKFDRPGRLAYANAGPDTNGS